MAHIGILCPSWLGHLNPMCNLGDELQRRGHQVTLVGWPDVEEKIAKTNLGYYKIGVQDFPRGSLSELNNQLSKLNGSEENSFLINLSLKATEMMFREAPDAICKAGVDFLIVDQITFAGGTIADHLRLPFVTICNSLPLHQEPGIPPSVTLRKYQNIWWAKLRNQLDYYYLNYLTRSIWNLVTEQRKRWKLPAYRNRDSFYSPLAQICQYPEPLDFPREELPPWFHYVGSFKSRSGIEPTYRKDEDFPIQDLGNKQLIYASLGTIFHSRKKNIFRKISEACLGLDVHLVIDLGDPTADPSETDFPNAIVFPFAPHQRIIDKASLVITHAGSTVIDCLQAGVPMVAIPIANFSDLPGIAARIAQSGSGEAMPSAHLNTTALKNCIERVLQEPSYRANAERLSVEIKKSGGLPRAADIVEQAIKTRAPVINL